MPLHIIKLVVGCDTIEDLLAWRRSHPQDDWRVHTRQTPKRAEELLQGGSLYWGIKGVILCRQRILEVRALGQGTTARCEILLDDAVRLTDPAPRRAFQGWRYLSAADAPADLPGAEAGDMPSDLASALRTLGAW